MVVIPILACIIILNKYHKDMTIYTYVLPEHYKLNTLNRLRKLESTIGLHKYDYIQIRENQFRDFIELRGLNWRRDQDLIEKVTFCGANFFII